MHIYIQQLVNSKKAMITLTAALSGLGGAACGYIYAQKKFEKIYAERAQQDINEMKEHYASEGFEKLRKEGSYADPVSALQKVREERYDPKELEALAAYVEEVQPYQGSETNVVVEDEAVPLTEKLKDEVAKSVFASDDADSYFDWDEELEKRKTAKIYVITKDEFFANETDYSQDTLTYFEGDDVLVDAHESIIKDVAGTVDFENLYRFGHGSDDPNVVYIRNVNRDLEIEVLRSEGKYSEEVLGFIQHDDRPRMRKFRSDDE